MRRPPSLSPATCRCCSRRWSPAPAPGAWARPRRAGERGVPPAALRRLLEGVRRALSPPARGGRVQDHRRLRLPASPLPAPCRLAALRPRGAIVPEPQPRGRPAARHGAARGRGRVALDAPAPAVAVAHVSHVARRAPLAQPEQREHDEGDVEPEEQEDSDYADHGRDLPLRADRTPYPYPNAGGRAAFHAAAFDIPPA